MAGVLEALTKKMHKIFLACHCQKKLPTDNRGETKNEDSKNKDRQCMRETLLLRTLQNNNDGSSYSITGDKGESYYMIQKHEQLLNKKIIKQIDKSHERHK